MVVVILMLQPTLDQAVNQQWVLTHQLKIKGIKQCLNRQSRQRSHGNSPMNSVERHLHLPNPPATFTHPQF